MLPLAWFCTKEAQILTKFDTFIYKIVKNHQMIFRKDPCTHTPTRAVNARARFVATNSARASLCLVCMRMCTDLYEKSFDYSLLSYK